MWHFSIAQSQVGGSGGWVEADVDADFFVFDARFVGAFFAAPALAAPSKIAPGAGGGMGTGCVRLGVDIW
jgi:hypothetical protein